MRSILIVGGAGVFGRRLARGLAASGELGLVFAGRDLDRARAAAAEFGASAVRLDVASVMPEQLRATGAFAVADAAGPYQGGDYRLARAAIAAGLHYVDLADARDFVAGFPALDAAARAAGVTALTGASSTPALSNAVLDRLVAGWQRIDRIEVAIAPGNRAPRGLAVMRSILSYVGKPVRVFQGGAWRDGVGWGGLVRRQVEGCGRRWLSLVDVPDLDILPARFAPRDAAIFRAGLELPLLHLGLAACGWPVRLGLIPSLVPLAAGFLRMAGLVERFGSDRGFMLVEAAGLDAEGASIRADWTLVAESGDGPFIPTLPALAALRALADGRFTRRGAAICAGLLPLDWIEREFLPYRIATKTRISRDPLSRP
jgi:NAD(P)-dependent dehydrogenase (short-subunit alcohol dehydrogenase family)